MCRECPYCGVEIAVAEDKISSSWGYSRCYQCSGLIVVKSPMTKSVLKDKAKRRLVQMARMDPEPEPAMVEMPTLEPRSEQETITFVPPPAAEAKLERSLNWPRAGSSRGMRNLAFSCVVFVVALVFYQINHLKQSLSVATDSGTETAAAPVEHTHALTAKQVVATSTESERAPSAAMTESPSASADPTQQKVMVQVTAPSAILRAGPGVMYRRVGLAQSPLKLNVKSWKADWLEVEVEAQNAGSVGANLKSVWIRKDLVRVLDPKAEKASL